MASKRHSFISLIFIIDGITKCSLIIYISAIFRQRKCNSIQVHAVTTYF